MIIDLVDDFEDGEAYSYFQKIDKNCEITWTAERFIVKKDESENAKGYILGYGLLSIIFIFLITLNPMSETHPLYFILPTIFGVITIFYIIDHFNNRNRVVEWVIDKSRNYIQQRQISPISDEITSFPLSEVSKLLYSMKGYGSQFCIAFILKNREKIDLYIGKKDDCDRFKGHLQEFLSIQIAERQVLKITLLIIVNFVLAMGIYLILGRELIWQFLALIISLLIGNYLIDKHL